MTSRVLVFRLLLIVVVLLSGAALVLGLSLVMEDAAMQGEMFDGLGLALGGMIVAASLVVAALAVVAIVQAERRWAVARGLGVVLAVVVAGVTFPLGIDSAWTPVVAAFAVALLLVAAVPQRSDR